MKDFLKHKVFKYNLFGVNFSKLSVTCFDCFMKVIAWSKYITCSLESGVLEFG